MKNILSIVLLTIATTFLSGVAHAGFPKDAAGAALLLRANVASPLEGLGTVVDRTKSVMAVVWDFSVYGGAVGAVNLLDDQGNPAIVPLGAYLTNIVCVAQTAVTTAASGTLAFGLLASSDLTSSGPVSAGTLTLGAKVAGTSVGTAATWIGPVVAVGGTRVTATIATGALTAGKVKCFLEYVIQ